MGVDDQIGIQSLRQGSLPTAIGIVLDHWGLLRGRIGDYLGFLCPVAVPELLWGADWEPWIPVERPEVCVLPSTLLTPRVFGPNKNSKSLCRNQRSSSHTGIWIGRNPQAFCQCFPEDILPIISQIANSQLLAGRGLPTAAKMGSHKLHVIEDEALTSAESLQASSPGFLLHTIVAHMSKSFHNSAGPSSFHRCSSGTSAKLRPRCLRCPPGHGC